MIFMKKGKSDKHGQVLQKELENMEIGLWAIIKNTDRLLLDSELLLKKKRYSASVPLSILAIEESGKVLFLSSLIQLKKPLSEKFWNEVTKGGISHVKKTTGLIFARTKYLENRNDEDSILDETLKNAGIKLTELKRAKIDNMIMKATFLRLEKLKHDCLYTDMDKNKNWKDFDSRFNSYEKKAIATYLYILSLRQHVLQKFSLSIPQKPFVEYTINEKKMLKTKWKKEVKSIMKKTDTRELGRLTDHGILLIHNNYLPDSRGFVKESKEGWFEI